MTDDRPGQDLRGETLPGGRPEHVIEEASGLTATEEKKVVERLRLRAPAIYAVVKEEGESELTRPSASLFWSGISAGIAMGFSILTLAILRMRLPDTDWAPIVSSFGYATGFLIVIFGELKLFTESTITAVLPVFAERSWSAVRQLARAWSIVLAANWIGCVIVAAGFVTFSLVPQEISAAVVDSSQHYASLSAGAAFLRAIGAGFLLAALVWLMPNAENHKFLLVALTGWLVSLAGFTHVISGMVEIAVLVLASDLSALDALLTLALPTLAGNILGGTALFSVLAYIQIKDEVPTRSARV